MSDTSMEAAAWAEAGVVDIDEDHTRLGSGLLGTLSTRQSVLDPWA